MRYAQIRTMDISNGEGIGCSLFVQGCPHHCFNCFNQETWDFNGGKPWTGDEEVKFFNIVGRPYVKRVTFLGGEPLAPQNCFEVRKMIDLINMAYPDKKVWIYTGYTLEELGKEQIKTAYCADVLVDGPFIEALKDLTLPYRGSSNQRLIDIPQTIKKGEIVLWKE